jgi:hypothetical protein
MRTPAYPNQNQTDSATNKTKQCILKQTLKNEIVKYSELTKSHNVHKNGETNKFWVMLWRNHRGSPN